MNKLFSLTAVAVAAVFLSGCSLTELAKLVGAPLPPQGPGAPAKIPGDVDGDGTVSAGETVLAAYVPTYATNANTTVTSAQVNGVQGVASSSTSQIAAAQTQGTFKVATITMAPNASSLTVRVDGKDFTLPRLQNPPPQGGAFSSSNLGPNVDYYWFGADQYTSGDRGVVFNQKYSSLSVFGRNVASNGGTSDGYVLVATGLETPESNMPAQLAVYNGAWALMLFDGNQALSGEDGKFVGKADFAGKTLTYDVYTGPNFDQRTNGGTATISGNHISGQFSTAAFGPGSIGTGEIIGTFYGPNAEELAGVLAGSATDGNGNSATLSGGFIGQKQ